MEFETLAVHAGHQVDPATGDVTPPIHLSTTFERSEDGTYPRVTSTPVAETPTEAPWSSAWPR